MAEAVRDARAFKQASQRAFDMQAATYDKEMQGSHARALYPFVLDELARIAPKRVLDMGCGTGALSERVLEAFPACELIGVDLSEEMLARAQKRLGNRAQVRAGDCERLPFSDASFDAIVCNDSFHHYPDPERAAFEAWRVLAPGGSLVVGDCWLPQPGRALMNAFLPYGESGDVRIYSAKEMRALFGKWFGTVEWKRIGFGSCIVKAVK